MHKSWHWIDRGKKAMVGRMKLCITVNVMRETIAYATWSVRIRIKQYAAIYRPVETRLKAIVVLMMYFNDLFDRLIDWFILIDWLFDFSCLTTLPRESRISPAIMAITTSDKSEWRDFFIFFMLQNVRQCIYNVPYDHLTAYNISCHVSQEVHFLI